jgi:predicted metal-dependent peptidase
MTVVAQNITGSILRLRLKSPFFATLAMHARFIERSDIPTAATDGRDVFYNAEFLGSLTLPELDGVLLHEVLHAALGHVTRRGGRDPQRWNIAADIVVNGLIDEQGMELPGSPMRDAALCGYSVEEVYTLLPPDQSQPPGDQDLLEPPPGSPPSPLQRAVDPNNDGDGQSGDGGSSSKPGPGRPSVNDAKSLERHWRAAASQAAAVARGGGKGELPAGIERAFELRDYPKLDWRSVLWRFMANTATDFATFDRRYMHQGLYLETLEDQNLRVAVCVDTSGSINEELISALMTEVQGVLRAYPGLFCTLFFADAELYGPFEITSESELPSALGGGGTDFRPLFDRLEADPPGGEPPSVCIYMTDGFGDFPSSEPRFPVLWAIVPGGLDEESFPFGETVRLVD